jgi:predicted HAD superfamily Cof-like phosphohydrolase
MMDDTVRMVAEFFRAFELWFPHKPSAPFTTATETGKLLEISNDMTNLSRKCWELAAGTKHKGASGLFLRLQLIQEELAELAEAMAYNDTLSFLDALSDLQYVLDNAYVAYGFHEVKLPAFQEVHASNMSKLTAEGRPLKDNAGRVMKSDRFRPPNLAPFVEGTWQPEESSTDASSEDSHGG